MDRASLDEKVKKEESEKEKLIIKNSGGIEINTKELICLNLFHWLYRSLGELDRLGLANASQNFENIFGSDFYVKVHHFMTEKIGTPIFGMLEEILKRLSDIMSQPGQLMDFNILFEFNKDKKVGFIWVE